jgi:hypothetical protein
MTYFQQLAQNQVIPSVVGRAYDQLYNQENYDTSSKVKKQVENQLWHNVTDRIQAEIQ